MTHISVNPQILVHLWEQLIRDEKIALLELVKNSYDADASNVSINFVNIDNQDIWMITISDDWVWMDKNTIENKWLSIWESDKWEKVKNWIKTEKYNRLPIWEKWIWRFWIHKLWNSVELISKRKESNKEVYLKINWLDFAWKKDFEEVSIDVIERELTEFDKKTSWTILRISNLKIERDINKYQNVSNAIYSIQPFFKEIENFTIKINLDLLESTKILNKSNGTLFSEDEYTNKIQSEHRILEWNKDILKRDEIAELALYKGTAILEWSKIASIKYDFLPNDIMSQSVQGRSINEKDEYLWSNLDLYQDWKVIDLEKKGIWKVKLEFLMFNWDKDLRNLSNINHVKKYLSENSWVRVYRDWIRVYNYWEKDNDWLWLSHRRMQRFAGNISKNLIIWAVYIDRLESTGLIEKSNREWFVENKAFEYFKWAIIKVVKTLSQLRYEDIQKVKLANKGGQVKSQPIKNEINWVNNIVEKLYEEKVLPEKEYKSIKNLMSNLESEYEHFTDVLITSASAWLNMWLIIHEMEKIVKETKLSLKLINAKETENDSKNHIQKAKKLVAHLQSLIKWYSILIRKTWFKNLNISKLIRQASFNLEYRFEAHKVDFNYDVAESIEVFWSEKYLLWCIQNILDNAIYRLDRKAKIKWNTFEKKIHISCYSDTDNTYLIIENNWRNLTIEPSLAVKPLVSDKEWWMWLWLHLCNEVMKSHSWTFSIANISNDLISEKTFSEGVVCMFKIPNNA